MDEKLVNMVFDRMLSCSACKKEWSAGSEEASTRVAIKQCPKHHEEWQQIGGPPR